MSKYGEPLRRRDASIVRSDGTTVVKGTSRRDPRCTKCQCSASTFVHVESAERMIACTNACANIPHPEMLPELVEAVTGLCKAHDEYAVVVNSSQAPFPHHARCVAKITAAEKRVMRARRSVMGESE